MTDYCNHITDGRCADTDHKINVLDFKIANLIAAGEVVERPASAIKELIENSVDAGAKNITVEIQNGGISLMRVTDDGCGMSREDAELCIRRHATSKIKDESDLGYIVTLGFRGEALAAISSVTRLRIFTKRSEDETGTLVECEGGKIVKLEDVGCSNGTTVIAEELFANVPARRKFLKKDASETMAVTSAVEKAALAHPELSFKLICDGRVRYQTPGDGDLRSAVYAVMGRDVANRLIEVQALTDGIEVTGFIGTPELARKNRHSENFFINGRYIKSTTASSAVEAAFQTYIPSDKFPVCMLHLRIHPTLVDVNVHPSKLEVKFSSERSVFDAVYSAVRGALVHSISRPVFDVHPLSEDSPVQNSRLVSAFVPMPDRTEKEPLTPRHLLDIGFAEPEKENGKAEEEGGGVLPPVYTYTDSDAPPERSALYGGLRGLGADGEEKVGAGLTPASPNETPSAQEDRNGRFVPVTATPDIPFEAGAGQYSEQEKPTWAESGETDGPDISGAVGEGAADPGAQSRAEASFAAEPGRASGARDAGYRIIGVAADAYVFVELDDRVLVIDKHAAHERILFEQMKENMKKSSGSAQVMLLPEVLTLDGAEFSAAEEYRAEILATGFYYECDADSRTVTVTEIPSEIDHASAADMFMEILSRLCDGGEGADISRDMLYERALFQASCKAAVKAGRSDDMSHIRWICHEVITNPRIRYCPHGRPVAFEMTKHDIERKFGRI